MNAAVTLATSCYHYFGMTTQLQLGRKPITQRVINYKTVRIEL
ncbi:hypothetical protein Y11_15741 [Yersinia enterocolitica subsp. palearctica Y11]|uniref:Uncharacterized protein n=1 Tax=Yersinia enterocolitica subsp. palearctica serotype O:3 (strain DSM 13030 / CIP 106945 / Y11) TaxID=930944 RepID=A0A0H3NNE1_YERE1|nr:hypothetical protein Y11_15741 [Yersinia enterocolitica subsp. palearctica Y11]CCO69185.1 hypothetical protein D322_2311 [Yersinia enterocolitica IP 10393]